MSWSGPFLGVFEDWSKPKDDEFHACKDDSDDTGGKNVHSESFEPADADCGDPWELVEVTGSYSKSALGGIILKCTGWRKSSKCNQELKRDLVLGTLVAHHDLVDTKISGGAIRIHYRQSCLQSAYDEASAGSHLIHQLTLAKDPDPEAAKSMDDPAISAVFMCLGFSSSYTRKA